MWILTPVSATVVLKAGITLLLLKPFTLFTFNRVTVNGWIKSIISPIINSLPVYWKESGSIQALYWILSWSFEHLVFGNVLPFLTAEYLKRYHNGRWVSEIWDLTSDVCFCLRRGFNSATQELSQSHSSVVLKSLRQHWSGLTVTLFLNKEESLSELSLGERRAHPKQPSPVASLIQHKWNLWSSRCGVFAICFNLRMSGLPVVSSVINEGREQSIQYDWSVTTLPSCRLF